MTSDLMKAADELAEAVESRMNDLGGYDGRFPVRKALTAYLTARESAGEVKVKPLVWKNGHAHGVGHHYFTRNGCLYRGEFSGKTGLHCGPAWELEEVAQADYETRIRSALVQEEEG